MKIFLYVTLIITIIGISTSKLYSQDIKVYKDYEEFHREIIINKSDRPRIVNFWALYCKPCMEELPYFISLSKKDLGFDIVFVSLDFDRDKLEQFASKNGIIDNAVWLTAPKQNSWIPRVHEKWDGPIPITLFISKDKKVLSTEFYHSEEQLENDIKKYFK